MAANRRRLAALLQAGDSSESFSRHTPESGRLGKAWQPPAIVRWSSLSSMGKRLSKQALPGHFRVRTLSHAYGYCV